jgi:hypothetical protein
MTVLYPWTELMPMKSSSNVHERDVYQKQVFIRSRLSPVLWHPDKAVTSHLCSSPDYLLHLT